MNKLEQNMQEIFDIDIKGTELVPKEEAKVPVVNEELKNDLEDAYQQSKDNLQHLIDQGKDAMEEILNIAKNSQHPRAFEVYGTLLKNMTDANKELLSIQKQMREISGAKQEASQTNIDKAAIFVGSTAELNKLLKGKA
jgi:nitrate reductase alpha subunit